MDAISFDPRGVESNSSLGFLPCSNNRSAMVASLSLLSPTTFSGLVSGNQTDKICLPKRAIQLPIDSFQRRTSYQLLHSRAPASSSSFPVVKAVAVESDQMVSSQTSLEEKRKTYHFVVANAQFMLDEEEHFKEQLEERLRHFGDRNKEKDFWLVIEPKFLDKFPEITKRLKRPAVALVSTDPYWMRFMRLRLDKVLKESFEADTLEEALACFPVDLHFKKPEKWVAPYPKYESGWWEIFLPPKA